MHPPRRRVVPPLPFLAALALGISALSTRAWAAPIWGRDFVPDDRQHAPLLCSPSDCGTLLDAVNTGSEIWLLFRKGDDFVVRLFDPSTGGFSASSSYITILTADKTYGSMERCGINSAQIGLCAGVQVTSESLTHTGSRWYTGHIGANPSTITISRTSGTCTSPAPSITAGSFAAGYKSGSTYTNDSFQISNAGTCAFTASYTYTNCSYDAAAHDAFRCPVYSDATKTGFCKLFMLYEGDSMPNPAATCSDSLMNRNLLLANSQEIDGDAADGEWVRFVPHGGTTPIAADVRINNTSAHEGGPANDHSFASVPALIRDPGDALWRTWFVSEDGDSTGSPGTSIRWSESDDDGLNWKIGGAACTAGNYDCGTAACWNGSAFDTTACKAQTWASGPPDDIHNTAYRNPDVVDPEVFLIDADGDSDLELGMMFTGADRAPTSPVWGVQLFGYHQYYGDESGANYWTWESSVQANASTGVVLDWDRSSSTVGQDVMDPEIVKAASGKFLMFYNSDSTYPGVYWSASGYQCSNFLDDDGVGGADYPNDGDCSSPSDNSE